MDVRIENCFYSAEDISQITAKAVQQMAKRGKMAKIARIVNDEKTRANTGHVVLISASKPPKLKRRNGRMDGRMDRWTDIQTHL